MTGGGYDKFKSQVVDPVVAPVVSLFRHNDLILAVLAIATGFIVGWAVVGFRHLIDLFQIGFFGSGGENLATIAAALPMWQILLAPCAGGLIVGLFHHYVMPGGKPQGVAKVIEASALKMGRLPLWPGIAATFSSALSIGAGASVGREGPAVLLGATLSSWIGQTLNLGRSAVRTLLGCGGAAAVAASFNAPIAGALFAHEVIVGHYALNAFAPVVLASIAATMVSRGVYGDYPAFIIPPFEAIEWIEFPAFALTGVACGLVAVVLMRGIAAVKKGADRFQLPIMLRPALAGLAVGLLALQLPDILGVGYEQTDRALRNAYPIATVGLLIGAKLVATALCLGWGFGGGIFSPSLALGALVGVAIGTAATMVGQDLSSGPAAYALVGMGALSASVLGAPISTTLIIFELTGDYTLTIAVMVGVVISTLVSTRLSGTKSFFLAQLRESGLSLDGGQDVSGLKGTRVTDFLSPSIVICSPETTRADAQARLLSANLPEVFVANEDGMFLGIVPACDLAELTEATQDAPITDLVHSAASVVYATDTVEIAVRGLLEVREGRLPVVESWDNRKLLGAIAARDLLRAVNVVMLSNEADRDAQ